MKRLNILLIGGANSLTAQLIRQFQKEGHRISLLTGSANGGQVYPRVFERYDLAYTSDAIGEVFNSVSPDVTVYTGAYDSNFRWDDVRRDAVAYVSAAMNILSAYTAAGKGRMLYLSSDAVFAACDGITYAEDDALNAEDPRGAALAQAEDICRRCMADGRSDIVIVRLSGVYHQPKTQEDLDDALSALCVRYLRDGALPVPDDRQLMPLAMTDAVFFLSRIALSKTHHYSVYHLSSGKTLCAGELKEKIRLAAEKASYKIPDGTETDGAEAQSRRAKWKADRTRFRTGAAAREKRLVQRYRRQAMLDADRFREEFGVNRLSDFEADLSAIVTHMIGHGDTFLGGAAERVRPFARLKKKGSWLFGALLPFAENLLCFALFYLLNDRLGGGKYFAKLDFYLIYVLLFALLYGQHQAILSAFLASALTLFVRLGESAGGKVLLDYNTYVWIAQLFILGFVVGYLKDRLADQKSEAEQDYAHMTQQLDDVREINESNVRVKDALQTEIINQNDSIGKIYEITATLDRYQSEDVFFQAMDILRRIMGSDDIALYTVANDEYARLFSATSELAASLGNSIRYRELDELYDAIRDGKPYINRALRADRPMMACAISEGDKPVTIIMIWSLPWEKMTLGQAGILTVTSMLIQNALLRAHRFLNMMRSERMIGDTRILKPDAFSTLIRSYERAADRRLTQFTLLRIRTIGDDAVETGRLAAGCLRQEDHIGLGSDGELYALLPNTSSRDAAFAISHLDKVGLEASVEDRARIEATV